jgi:YHS domain-containing protein
MPQRNPLDRPGAGDEAVQEALEPQSGANIPFDQRAIDPVCGEIVDMRKAQYTTNFPVDGGNLRTFYFSSDECKQLFERNPEKYMTRT